MVIQPNFNVWAYCYEASVAARRRTLEEWCCHDTNDLFGSEDFGKQIMSQGSQLVRSIKGRREAIQAAQDGDSTVQSALLSSQEKEKEGDGLNTSWVLLFFSIGNPKSMPAKFLLTPA